MNTKAFFPSGAGSNLILGTGMENQIFILRTPAPIKFLSCSEEFQGISFFFIIMKHRN